MNKGKTNQAKPIQYYSFENQEGAKVLLSELFGSKQYKHLVLDLG